jgi:hypothetical protein
MKSLSLSIPVSLLTSNLTSTSKETPQLHLQILNRKAQFLHL